MKRWQKWLVASLVAIGILGVPVAGWCLNITWDMFLLLLLWISEGGNPLDLVLGLLPDSGIA